MCIRDSLTGVGFFTAVQHRHTGQLLGDGTAALYDAAGFDIGHHSAGDADGIDALMGIETLVLDGDQSIDHIGRDIGKIHGYAIFSGMQLVYIVAVFI